MVTFAIILLLPSSLTLITLLIHRVRASNAAQRDRAPEEIVKSLPSRVWTGTGLEKEHDDKQGTPSMPPLDVDLERDAESLDANGDSSTSCASKPHEQQAWQDSQVECAICLSDFVKGDVVRVLPCHHIFHRDEVDAWLIHSKKLVSRSNIVYQSDLSEDVFQLVPDLQSRCHAAIVETRTTRTFCACRRDRIRGQC